MRDRRPAPVRGKRCTSWLQGLFLCWGMLGGCTVGWACDRYTQVFEKLAHMPAAPVAARLNAISAQFMGTPYVAYGWGEGPDARFDQHPLYCFAVLDCETFVTAVLALALSHDQASYEQHLRQLRYHEGQVGFVTRHHFTATEWNVAAHRHGWLVDYTPKLRDSEQHPLFKQLHTEIDRAGWYRHLSPSRVYLPTANAALKKQRWLALRQQGQQLAPQHSVLSYIPFDALFDAKGAPRAEVFAQIPEGAILQIVRSHWPDPSKLGTHLDVSHLGFVFRQQGRLFFRHAAMLRGAVAEQPLVSYLQQARAVPSIVGIHLEVMSLDKIAHRSP